MHAQSVVVAKVGIYLSGNRDFFSFWQQMACGHTFSSGKWTFSNGCRLDWSALISIEHFLGIIDRVLSSSVSSFFLLCLLYIAALLVARILIYAIKSVHLFRKPI